MTIENVITKTYHVCGKKFFHEFSVKMNQCKHFQTVGDMVKHRVYLQKNRKKNSNIYLLRNDKANYILIIKIKTMWQDTIKNS